MGSREITNRERKEVMRVVGGRVYEKVRNEERQAQSGDIEII